MDCEIGKRNCFIKYKCDKYFGTVETSIICQIDSDIMNGSSPLAIKEAIFKIVRYYDTDVKKKYSDIILTDITILGVYND